MIRQRATAQNHAIRANEAVISNRNWSGRLTTAFEVNAMCQNLRSIARKCCESSNSDTACAVDEMTIRDGGVLTYDEFRPPVMLVCEVLGVAERTRRYPIKSADRSVLLQMQELQALAHRKGPNLRMGIQNQSFRHHPREPNATRGMNRVTEYSYQEPTSKRPRQQKRNPVQQFLHLSRSPVYWPSNDSLIECSRIPQMLAHAAGLCDQVIDAPTIAP